MKNETNNSVSLTGTVASDITFSHSVYSEEFLRFDLSVRRLSGSCDTLPIIMSKRLLDEVDPSFPITLNGQLRSYNMMCDGKSRLILKMFVRSARPAECDDDNSVFLQGYLCKDPVYRTTPFCREISDMLLAVNRSYGKSDYIPCICWGRNARFCRNMEISQYLAVVGRLQSRAYEKRLEDGSVQERIAYEVSVSRLTTDREQAAELADGILQSPFELI